MTTIPLAICRFSDNNFQRLYLKKKTHFVEFDCISAMFMKFRTFWKQKSLLAELLPKLLHPKQMFT